MWHEEFREQMPVTDRWAYFDHAAVAPLSGPAHGTLREWADEFAQNGDIHWPDWRKRLEEARNLTAKLIGADRSEIALIRNTTEGINLVSEGIPWESGDNVVVPAAEFPSNLYPWMHLEDRGVECRQVPAENERLDLNRLADACDDRTRIIAVSWVGYATGWRNDLDTLADIARRHGALLFVDAIQGLGVLPLDVSKPPIDFLAADGHKWLLGPEGAGVFYVRREHLDFLRPVGLGWNSVRHAGDFTNTRLDLKRTAGRYEGGTYNMAGLSALGASLELFDRYGVEAISERILEVTDRLCDRLRELGAEIISSRDGNRRSGIASFELPGRDALAVTRQCRDRGVALTCRAGRLRVSPHAYTSDDDLERLADALGGGAA